MSIVIQLASWAATAYLAYSFYQTGTYVYSLWSPPSCDPSLNAGECFCNSYTQDTSIHFEIYLSKQKKLQQNFQSNNQFKKVFSSALQPTSDDSDALPSSPVKLSFDSKAITHKTYINGRDRLYKLHKNKSHIYAHIISYIPPKSDSNYYYTSSIATDSIFSFLTVPVTYLAAPPPNTFNLKDMSSGKQQQKIQTALENIKLYDKVRYFQPNLTIFYVVDFNCYPMRGIPHDVFPYLRSNRMSQSKPKTSQTYDPIVFSSNLFQMHKYALPIMDASGDLLSNTNHTEYKYNLKNLTLEINIEPVSLGLFRLYLMMDNSNKQMQQQWGFTEHDSDQIKGLFVDTPPILTFATFAAAMLHSIFGVLAMKSDVSFWYTKDGADSLKGLSTNSVIFECISSFVITIYLIDSDQTNKIVIAFMCAECILGLWKVKRIWNIKAKIEFKASIEDYEISDSESESSSDSESDSDSDSDDESAKNKKKRRKKKALKKKKKKQKQIKMRKKKQREEQQKNKNKNKEKVEENMNVATESLDSKATRWMMIVMIPIVIGYGIYAFFYHKHKSILSFIINVSASCVYGLGFIHLTPQLFINYELQSVASLPWRVLIYRFFNTFVDDLFSFVIDMPLMHRLACFRDDIVFFIFLGQWYKYGSKKRKTD